MNPDDLLQRIRPVLARLEDDLLARSADPGVAAALAAEHAREVEARRTADPLEVWTRFRVTQIAAAWVLSLLFVRTLEDRDLVPHRLKAGEDHRAQLRALAPYLNDRDYLLVVFRELTRYRGVRDVFDAAHNPVWMLGPSAEMAAELLQLARSEQGLGGLDFSGDTRFLGDVYERLDEGVRKRFALLQTPDFVEQFILDRTLTPALAERGVDGLTVIDPTCGSGHFLLGAFQRLRAAWEQADPTAGPEGWAFKAIHQVFGVDVNPYAVAIARFRLVLAYADAAGLTDLDGAGDLRLNLAVADSLLPVDGQAQQELGAFERRPEARGVWGANPFAFGQGPDAVAVLGGRRFDVVVGNPPYIMVHDEVLREVYREQYSAAAGKYQLVVPFVQRFFGLASPSGWVGAIVGNGFMKRTFGKKLIEDFLPTVDLTQVVDTSGAFIPGHGTPTVMLFGRNRKPGKGPVLAVMGKRGEPTTPDDPSTGLVWTSIRDHHDQVGHEDDYLSVDELEREQLAQHPWSLKGGGADKLKALIEERGARTLGQVATDIGFDAIMGEDDVYIAPIGVWGRRGAGAPRIHTMVEGTAVRDWTIASDSQVYFPYDEPSNEPMAIKRDASAYRHLWHYRSRLIQRMQFGKTTIEAGLEWYEYRSFYKAKRFSPTAITFAFVATHNHFVLDRGGKVFKQSAPIIKLPPDATEDDHLALLGYLNSSTACFWMKQVSHPKGGSGIGRGIQPEGWMERFEFDGTKVGMTPIPALDPRLRSLTMRMEELSAARQASSYAGATADAEGSAVALRTALDNAEGRRAALRAAMQVGQEEVDWHVYGLFGLGEALGAWEDWEGVAFELGMRPFEILLAQAVAEGDLPGTDWFDRHGGRAHRAVPEALPEGYRRLLEGRLQAIRANKSLRLMEKPDYKRRWSKVDAAAERQEALRTWLLDRVEAEVSRATATRTVRQLARVLHRDPKVLAVAEVYADEPEPDLERLLADLVGADAVPYLAALRYNDKGLEKYRLWERTWEAQRREDAGESVEVPLPPKYGSGDFARSTYWSLRGKLDVPKERFVAYPGAEDTDDPSPVIGCTGWDHADRIAALAALIEAEPDPDKRVPLLAGMQELLPWVVQWHGDDDRYGTPLGELWTGHLAGLRSAHHLSEDDLRAWRPEKKARGRKPKGKAAARITLTRDEVVAAYEALAQGGEGVERNALAAELGVSGAAVTKAVQPLLDEGVWMVTKKRPIVYTTTEAG